MKLGRTLGFLAGAAVIIGGAALSPAVGATALALGAAALAGKSFGMSINESAPQNDWQNARERAKVMCDVPIANECCVSEEGEYLVARDTEIQQWIGCQELSRRVNQKFAKVPITEFTITRWGNPDSPTEGWGKTIYNECIAPEALAKIYQAHAAIARAVPTLTDHNLCLLEEKITRPAPHTHVHQIKGAAFAIKDWWNANPHSDSCRTFFDAGTQDDPNLYANARGDWSHGNEPHPNSRELDPPGGFGPLPMRTQNITGLNFVNGSDCEPYPEIRGSVGWDAQADEYFAPLPGQDVNGTTFEDVAPFVLSTSSIFIVAAGTFTGCIGYCVARDIRRRRALEAAALRTLVATLPRMTVVVNDCVLANAPPSFEAARSMQDSPVNDEVIAPPAYEDLPPAYEEDLPPAYVRTISAS